jgi:hypothetical protein
MCIFNEKGGVACNAAVPGSGTWGLSDSVCQAHFNHYKTQLANGVNFAAAMPVLEDYVRILALMQDNATFSAALRDLSQEIAKSYGHFSQFSGPWSDEATDRLRYKNGARPSIRISRILSYYEGYCWFPDSHANYAGLLDGTSFVWGLTVGLMPKDPGAGAAHGDFSHRLQWHVIMRVITHGFEEPVRNGWNHTPLFLFTSLGSGDALAARVWFFLLDNNSGANNSLGNSVSMKYSDPDNVNYLASRGDFELLKNALKARWDKRRVRQDEGDAYFNQFMAQPDMVQIRAVWNGSQKLKSVCNGLGVSNQLYEWRKLGGRPDPPAGWLNYQAKFALLGLPLNYNFTAVFQAAHGDVNHATVQPILQYYTYLTKRIAHEYWEENIGLRPLGARSRLQTPQANIGGAMRSMDGILTDPSVSLANIANRIASSRNGFNIAKYQKTYFGVARKSADV